MHTGSHQERQWLCSGSQCGQCGLSSACSWPGSTPRSRQHTWRDKNHVNRRRICLSCYIMKEVIYTHFILSQEKLTKCILQFTSADKKQQKKDTLTILSQPQDTIIGLLLLGENRTQDTHSEWPSSWKRQRFINSPGKSWSQFLTSGNYGMKTHESCQEQQNKHQWMMKETVWLLFSNSSSSHSNLPPLTDRHDGAADLDSVFADSQSVPQLDGLVPGARHNLAVVCRKCHAQNILGMTHKLTGGEAPETHHKAEDEA